MSLLHDLVLPTLDEASIPCLLARALPEQLVVPWVLDNQRSARTLIHITCFESEADLQIWADLCDVAPSKRLAMLELSNTFNAKYRWLKSTIAADQLLLEVDLLIGRDEQAPARFRGGFKAFIEALQAYWPDVSRLLARRGRRTRLERELDGLLVRHGGE